MEYWNNKTVVVTGGSEGLGREIAFSFARGGASVVALGRSPEKLSRLNEEASGQNLNILGESADVTEESSVQSAINRILEKHQQIDVWINNVGKSTRASVVDANLELYRDLMKINLYSAICCTRLVLEYLEKTSGHLVNIGSLASKTGYPLMAPYSASKHALAAFHHQLRLEGPQNVHYLHVCPGPIQRTDSETRYAQQAKGLGEGAAKPGGGVNMKGIPPRKLADQIERACRRRKRELVVPSYTRFLFALAQFAPGLTDRLLLRSKK